MDVKGVLCVDRWPLSFSLRLRPGGRRRNLDGLEEGRRNREIEGARIFAGVKRTAEEGRTVVEAEDILAEILEKIEKGEDIEIKDQIIRGDLDLDKIDLPTRKVTRNLLEAEAWNLEDDVKIVKSKIKIINSEFCGAVIMANTIFVKSVDFKETIFIRGVDFRGDKFKGYANFVSTQFGNNEDQNNIQEVHFEATKFLKDAYFTGAYFFGKSNFESAEFQKEAYFDFAQFYGSTQLVNVEFHGEVQFDNAHFFEDANFAISNFQKYAYFSTQFSKHLDLYDVRFHDVANFGAARFNENSKIRLNQAEFAKLYVDWSHFKDHLIYDLEGGEPVYLALIENFRDLGWFEDADDCYYEYRKAKMMENRSPIFSKIYDRMALLSCGYGVRPDFTIACISGTIIIFGILFWDISKITFSNLLTTLLKIDVSIIGFVLGHIPKFSNLERDMEGIFNYINSNLLQNCSLFLDNLYLSVMVFIGQTPSNFEPTGFLKFAAIIEGILGYLFLALFVVVLARKFIR